MTRVRGMLPPHAAAASVRRMRARCEHTSQGVEFWQWALAPADRPPRIVTGRDETDLRSSCLSMMYAHEHVP
eukprot:5113244-Pleurochrysis_carterae.AAC.1